MAKIKLLITGVGATPGICVAESLKLKFNSKELFIIGTDSNPYAVGLYLRKYVDCGILVERAKNNINKYIDTIKNIVKKHHIDFIFPTTDEEIVILKKFENSIKKDSVIASDLNTLEICTDQWLTYKNLSPHNLIVESWLKSNDVCFPCIIKPRKSQGSKNIYIAYNRKDFDILFTKTKSNIFQKLLVADEYTIDCIYNFEGLLIGAMPRKRILTAGGTSVITQNVRNEKTN